MVLRQTTLELIEAKPALLAANQAGGRPRGGHRRLSHR
jgi:hypothetical protein